LYVCRISTEDVTVVTKSFVFILNNQINVVLDIQIVFGLLLIPKKICF